MVTDLNLCTLSVLVENKAGVLARVSGLFARRGYNIYSLAVAPTDDEALSRITIVYDADSATTEQVVKQLFKLINVIRIDELDQRTAIERELLLATLKTEGEARSKLMEIVDFYKGSIVDVGATGITVMIADTPDRLDNFEELARPYGIASLQRTGRVALPQLTKTA